MHQLLVIEAIMKLSGGLLLLIAPVTIARLLGLHRPEQGFWPRLLGAALVGIAAASAIEAWLPSSNGLGLAGSVAINLVAAFVIISVLLMQSGAPTRRGRLALWLLTSGLVLLALVEIAYV